MTVDGLSLALEEIERKKIAEKNVMVVYLPNLHESLAGIVAGRIREKFHHPVFVLTDSEEGVKGSGRSVEAYSMYEEMCKCGDLFLKFGGHPMAAGLTLPKEKVAEFTDRINRCANAAFLCDKRTYSGIECVGAVWERQ